MWDTFLPDLIVAVIGALLTVLIALVTYLLKVRLDEKRAIRSLINELHRRRALAEGPEPVVENAAQLDDYTRANASIVSIRREIRLTRDRVRQIEAIQSHLSAMTRSCNRYLELSDASPDRYAIYLGDLRRELTPLVERLARTHRGIANHEPGGGAV
jgi:hypothetical protein